jgi:hypothetical protein
VNQQPVDSVALFRISYCMGHASALSGYVTAPDGVYLV